MADKQEEGAAVPAAQRAGWGSFIKSLAGFSGDLYSMTAPPFILSPISLTEFAAYWLERPEDFAAINDGVDEQDRALRVLKWFIATLKGQYTTRNEKMGSEKKPLNPVLGELFFGTWPDLHGRGETTLTVEQVSHHPPITAYHIANAAKGLTLQGHNAQKTSFAAGSIVVRQVGHATLTHRLPDGRVEKYLITFPRLRIDGLWYGCPYVELTDTSYIVSSTGYTASIEYKGKGYFGGKVHQYKATLVAPDGASTVAVAEGSWDGVSKVSSTKSRHVKANEVFVDVTGPKEEVTVKPMEQQGEWETRKLWELVAKGIRTGDYELASREKTKIENEQRQRRKDEAAAGTPWKLRYFVHVENDPDYEALVEPIVENVGVVPTEDAYVYQAPSA